MPRPRQHDSASARAAAAARRVKEAGGARKTIVLSAEALAALTAIQARTGETAARVVERLLVEKVR